jgi:hypothetical protein
VQFALYLISFSCRNISQSQVTGNADLSTVETLATAQGETLSSTVERSALPVTWLCESLH